VVLADVPRVEYVQGTLYGLMEDDALRRARAVRGGYDPDDPDDADDPDDWADEPEEPEEPRRRFGRRKRTRS
jgi:hypothetical protein